MKVRITVSVDVADIRALQAAGRLSAEKTPREALIEEFEAVIQAHVEGLQCEAEIERESEAER